MTKKKEIDIPDSGLDMFTKHGVTKIRQGGTVYNIKNTDDMKKAAIKEFTEMTAKAALKLFLMLDLKVGFEGMIVEQNSGKEFVLSFYTAEEYEKRMITKTNQL